MFLRSCSTKRPRGNAGDHGHAGYARRHKWRADCVTWRRTAGPRASANDSDTVHRRPGDNFRLKRQRSPRLIAPAEPIGVAQLGRRGLVRRRDSALVAGFDVSQ